LDQGLDRDQGLIAASPGQSACDGFTAIRTSPTGLVDRRGGADVDLFYVGSLASLFLTSLYRLNEDGSGIEKVIGLQNYKELADSSVYLDITLRTIKIAALVTLLDIVLALPIAFFMAKVVRQRFRRLLVAAVLVPLWASYLVKAFSWRAIIGVSGVLDKTFDESQLRRGRVGDRAGVPVAAAHGRRSTVWNVAGFTARRIERPRPTSDSRSARSCCRCCCRPSSPGQSSPFAVVGDYIAVDLVGGNTQVIGSVVFDNFSADLPFGRGIRRRPCHHHGVHPRDPSHGVENL
jgi:putative spermidine/putrescine transport system permease protein